MNIPSHTIPSEFWLNLALQNAAVYMGRLYNKFIYLKIGKYSSRCSFKYLLHLHEVAFQTKPCFLFQKNTSVWGRPIVC